MTFDIDKRPPPRDEKLTRVAVRHIYFRGGGFTFAGIENMTSNLPCYQVNNANRWVTCDWIPAWQMFEFSFHAPNNNKDEIRVRYVPAAHVDSWQREDGGR